MADDVKDDENGNENDDGAKPDELGEAGKRALESERAARKAAEKGLKELQSKVTEFENAGKSELEKLQGQVADLTTKAEAATANADRWEVAIDAGLTKAQARRLVGATKEELEADAVAMAEELGLKKTDDDEGDKPEDAAADDIPEDERPLGRPKEELKDGAAPKGEETVDASKLATQILASPWS